MHDLVDQNLSILTKLLQSYYKIAVYYCRITYNMIFCNYFVYQNIIKTESNIIKCYRRIGIIYADNNGEKIFSRP